MTEGTQIATTDYQTGFQYLNGELLYFPTAEGYVNNTVINNQDNYDYVYNYTDHLGNIRLSYTKDPNTGNLKILEEMRSIREYHRGKQSDPLKESNEQNNYCPFGLKHSNYNKEIKEIKLEEYTGIQGVEIAGEGQHGLTLVPALENEYQYKYNGKELQTELNLNTYAYGWRDYDPAIGRFNKIDRYAEKYPNLSTYSYAGNNPVIFVDVQGDSIQVGSERRAARMERRAERKADRLERKVTRMAANGKNTGDMMERVGELRQSAQDIRDMRSDPNEWYAFKKANSKDNPLRDPNNRGLPVTLRTGINEITMFMPSFKNWHEPRHGGQIARGDYTITGIGLNSVPSSTYGAQEEISAYRAQYSSMSGMGAYGSLTYLPSFTPSNADALKLVTGQATMLDIYKNYQQSVTNINNINANLLMNMYDTNGFNQNPIYANNPTIWWSN